eukprot:4963494-Prorocentrum_lima.AAC.1
MNRDFDVDVEPSKKVRGELEFKTEADARPRVAWKHHPASCPWMPLVLPEHLGHERRKRKPMI